MVKIIISDVDGTLLKKGETVLDSRILLAIQQHIEKGTIFAVASGRSYGSLEKLFAPFADKLYFICCDGGVTVHKGKAIYTRPIGASELLSITENELYRDCGIVLCTPTKSFILRGDDEFAKEIYAVTGEKCEFLTGLYSLREPVVKLCVHDKNKSAAKLPFLSPLVRVSYNDNGWCEYVSSISNKGNAASDLQMRLYLSKFDTLALGDGVNDVELMKKAKYAACVNSACPELKSVCNLFTDDPADFLSRY